jgi:two-component system, OmpR family, phosphate regulon sensor histidine kinase PhoR
LLAKLSCAFPDEQAATGVDMRREKTIYLTMILLIAGALSCLIDISHRIPPPLPAQFGQLGTVLLTLGAAAGLLAYIHVRRQWQSANVHDDLVSRVSHELRTPLASIRAYAEMLIDGEVRDEKTARASYEIIQSEATRLSRLVDNVLNMARIQAGHEQIVRCAVSMSALCRKTLDVIAPQASLKSIAIVSDLAPDTCLVLGDRDLLCQALLNLISNAVKYTPERGRITVQTVADVTRGKIIVRIYDTGVGIPPKDLPFVFDKFYRAEANNHMAPGTGLGLSLVKQIIQTVHHGRMMVESEVGMGSCFGFELNLIP